MRNVKQSTEVIAINENYEELLNGERKRIINIIRKQDEILKTFKDNKEFFIDVGLNQSNIYFKVKLHKFLTKFPVFKNQSSYFKNNFKLLKKIYQENVGIFGRNE